jgi:glycosyltransferase involved in cell wall biosynthesis
MNEQRVIALLGRRDEPTDAVEDYCRYLGQALVAHNFKLEIRRVPWNEQGWAASLEALRLQADAWRGAWVLVQYTALAWSARGFPGRIFRVLRVLRKAGTRIAIVFHDVEPFGGSRLIDRIRRRLQIGAMKDMAAFSDRNIFTIALNCISWLDDSDSVNESSFIPVGANLPFPLDPQLHNDLHSPPTIGVFSITGGTPGDRETRDVIAALRIASEKLGKLRLFVFGRHAEVREAALRRGLGDLPIELSVEGVVDASELVKRFADSDILLFVRGTISTRRGSAIAGIACGLPMIALQGRETAPPITDAGVVLLAEGPDEAALQSQLGEAIVRVLSDNDLRTQLAQRSRSAQEKYFSWSAIAERYADLLQDPKLAPPAR